MMPNYTLQHVYFDKYRLPSFFSCLVSPPTGVVISTYMYMYVCVPLAFDEWEDNGPTSYIRTVCVISEP